MYKMNLLLKILVSIMYIVMITITKSTILLWILFLFLLGLHFLLNKKKIYIFDYLIFIFMFFIGNIYVMFFTKILLFINVILTFILTLTFKEIKAIKRLYNLDSNSRLRKKFYKNNYDRILKYNKNKIKENYILEPSYSIKLEKNLERQYLQARIRFYGYNSKSNGVIYNSWCKIDTLLLIFSLIIFIIFILVSR